MPLFIGSYLWGTRAVDVLKSLMPNLNVQILDPVMVKGLPREEDFASLEKLAESIAEKHHTMTK